MSFLKLMRINTATSKMFSKSLFMVQSYVTEITFFFQDQLF